jgi:uncharacterized membrane protein YgdD (TMEM256/DUF423 family)
VRDRLLLIGIGAAFLAVALGAFAAHALKSRVEPADLVIFETGVRYQMYHALALVLLALVAARQPDPWLARAGWLFVLGIALFSGSLYLLVLTGARWWGAVTPFGGVAFLAGWLAFGWGVIRGGRP